MSDRHAFRAKWHNYNGGIYFVTICAHKKRHRFGRIAVVGAQCIAPEESNSPSESNNIFQPSSLGGIVEKCINEISTHHHYCEVWNYVVMPNHIHLVISINNPVGAQYIAPTEHTASSKQIVEKEMNKSVNLGSLKPPKHDDPVEDNHFNSALAVVIRTFKAAVTRSARAQCIAPLPVWQRNFHEHIIRDVCAFDNIMTYINNNIINWHKDCFYN